MDPTKGDKNMVSPPVTATEAQPPTIVHSPALDGVGTTDDTVGSPVNDTPTPSTNAAYALAAAASTDKFPVMYNYTIAAPIVSVLISSIFFSSITEDHTIISIIFAVLLLAALVAMAVAYVFQIKFLRKYRPAKSLKPQLVLIAAGFLLPMLAAIVGDVSGLAAFGDDASSSSLLGVGLIGGAVIGAVTLNVAAVGNLLTIHTKGMNNALRIVGKILYVIAWPLLLLLSYIMYALAYSARDPSVE